MQFLRLPPSLGPEFPYYARPRPEQVDICYRAACDGDLLKMGADSLELDSKGRAPRYWAKKEAFADVAHVLEEAERRRAKISSM